MNAPVAVWPGTVPRTQASRTVTWASAAALANTPAASTARRRDDGIGSVFSMKGS